MATKDTFKRVIVAAHPKLAKAESSAAQVAEFLSHFGLQVEHGSLNDPALQQRIGDGETDLLVTLGGDGTVLRAGHLCAPVGVPILAINQGRFGFLIEVAAEQWRELLPNLLSGDYWYENRMMLRAEQWREGSCLGKWEVLNEAMVGRGRDVRPVHLVTELDGRGLTTYVADGLIIATPTGSTAYALAAGGPILPPELRNILIMPVAPHLSVDRAIVLSEGSSISVTMLTGHQAVLSVDGQDSIDLIDGDRIDVRASKHTLRFVRFQDPGYFYRNLFALMDQHPSAGVTR